MRDNKTILKIYYIWIEILIHKENGRFSDCYH